MKYLRIIIIHKWLFLILLVATVLRFYHIDFQSLWMDESYTMNVSSPKLSWAQFHQQLLKREGFPHFYFVFLRILYSIFEYSSFIARSVSAVAGIASVYAIYLVSKELSNYKTGLIAALLLAVNEYQIYMSQEARPYTLYFLATCLSFYRLVLFIKNSTFKNAILYGLFTGILLNINFFGMINVGSQALIILFFLCISSKQNQFDYFKKALISGIIIILFFAPNYLMLNKLITKKSFWVKAPTPDSFSILFNKFLGDWQVSLFLIAALFLYYFIKLFQNKEEKVINSETIISNKLLFSFIILFGWFFVFFGFLMVKTYGKISYLLPRYFISITPVLIIVLAIAISLIKGKIVRFIVLTTLVFLMLTNLVVVKKHYTACLKSQYRELSFYVIKNKQANEKVFTEYQYWYDFYFNQKQSKTVNVTFEKLIISFKKNKKCTNSFWYIGLFKKPFAPSAEAQKFIDTNYILDKQYSGLHVWGKHFVLK